MENENALPRTLTEAVEYFSDQDNCLHYMVARRWPSGVCCPTCGSVEVRFIPTRRIWECTSKHPRKQFSVKVGTIFEDSPLGLDKWLPCVWMIANCKNGISSWEIHRALGVTQKTAWFMLHRVRLAMQNDNPGKLGGEVEADESFIGGKARNMHISKRRGKITGTGGKDKTAVMGIVERRGEVRSFPVPNCGKRVLQEKVREHVSAGSALFTDELLSYSGLDREYAHQVINHAIEYVRGNVHTNTIENFWSLFKRGLNGTYVSVEPFHLFRYLDEQSFRYNERRNPFGDAGRFEIAIAGIVGKRVTYKQLTGKEGETSIERD